MIGQDQSELVRGAPICLARGKATLEECYAENFWPSLCGAGFGDCRFFRPAQAVAALTLVAAVLTSAVLVWAVLTSMGLVLAVLALAGLEFAGANVGGRYYGGGAYRGRYYGGGYGGNYYRNAWAYGGALAAGAVVGGLLAAPSALIPASTTMDLTRMLLPIMVVRAPITDYPITRLTKIGQSSKRTSR